MSQLHRTIHLVDDDDGVRVSLRALLEAFDFAVEDYASGDAFLSAGAPDDSGCVLLDMHLPRHSGLEILNLLRGPLRSRIPVVMITGRGDRALQRQLIAAGADGYLEKPFNTDLLIESIESLAAAETPPRCANGRGAGVTNRSTTERKR